MRSVGGFTVGEWVLVLGKRIMHFAEHNPYGLTDYAKLMKSEPLM